MLELQSSAPESFSDYSRVLCSLSLEGLKGTLIQNPCKTLSLKCLRSAQNSTPEDTMWLESSRRSAVDTQYSKFRTVFTPSKSKKREMFLPLLSQNIPIRVQSISV